MNAKTDLWVDGEQIPDDRIEEIFQQPPGLPVRFLRSALIVGARGVGKTTLFRYLRKIHEGVAVHVSLVTEFASLTLQTGFGPLAPEIPKELEAGIIGKASALLATCIALRLVKRGISVPLDAMGQCLPNEIRAELTSATTIDVMSNLRTKVAETPLQTFD